MGVLPSQWSVPFGGRVAGVCGPRTLLGGQGPGSAGSWGGSHAGWQGPSPGFLADTAPGWLSQAPAMSLPAPTRCAALISFLHWELSWGVSVLFPWTARGHGSQVILGFFFWWEDSDGSKGKYERVRPQEAAGSEVHLQLTPPRLGVCLQGTPVAA